MHVKIRFNLLDVWQPVCRGTLQSRNQNFNFLQKRRLNLNWNTFWSNLSTDNTWMDYVRCQTGKTNVVLEYLGKIWTRICRNVAKTVPDRKPPVLLGTILWLYNMANPNIKAIWETDILANNTTEAKTIFLAPGSLSILLPRDFLMRTLILAPYKMLL